MITDKTIEIAPSRAALIEKMARAICVSRGLKPNEDWVLFRADCDAALEAAAPEIRREAIYECAKVCENMPRWKDISPAHVRGQRNEDYAAAIRALALPKDK